MEKEKNTYEIPGIPMNENERKTKLLEYLDDEFSNKEEEAYYKKETASYYARMDTSIEYNGELFYRKIYISKDEIIERKEIGVFDSSGVYILPSELRQMGKAGLITVEENKKGIFKEYEDGTVLVHWASPIAGLYNDNQNNKMKINEYTYSPMLKRSFSFNPLRFYNKYIAENKFYTDGTVDEFLIKILLDKKDSNKLTDIIYTIQGNQNRIIRANPMESFIVQGCAGSGKTMILLHRLSYLKFNNKLPIYEKIKIITPNHLFSNFIEDLTRDLSIENIEQITIIDYYKALNKFYIERYNKIEEIDYDFFKKQREHFREKFNNRSIFDEHESIGNIYSDKMLDMVKDEYNKLIGFYNIELKKNDIEVQNIYSNNQIYLEQIIKNISGKIENTVRTIKNIDEYSKYGRNRINDIGRILNNLSRERIKNNHDIEDLINKCRNIENEKQRQINKNKIKLKNAEIIPLSKKYKDIRIPKREKIEETQSYIDLKNKIKKMHILINEANKVKMQNNQEILQIIAECKTLENERNTKIKKKKMIFEISRNNSIFNQYSEMINIKHEQIRNLKVRQAKISEKQMERTKELNELIRKLKECKMTKQEEVKKNRRIVVLRQPRIMSIIDEYNKILNIEYDKGRELKQRQINNLNEEKLKNNEIEEINRKLAEYGKEKATFQIKLDNYKVLKDNIINDVYFTINIYEKIIGKIKERFGFIAPQNTYSKIDLVILLYINYLHIGELINSDKLLCIDEAQDYSEIEFVILRKINKNVIINLYGDTNQSIYKNGIYNWDNLAKKLNLNKYVLNENYRNPTEITNYCNQKFRYNILAMGLSIKSVEMIRKNQINEIIIRKIKENKRIAIISKENMEEKICNHLVTYCDIQEAKGIEYNTVIVNENGMSQNEKYIAYTRALGELYIVNSQKNFV